MWNAVWITFATRLPCKPRVHARSVQQRGRAYLNLVSVELVRRRGERCHDAPLTPALSPLAGRGGRAQRASARAERKPAPLQKIPATVVSGLLIGPGIFCADEEVFLMDEEVFLIDEEVFLIDEEVFLIDEEVFLIDEEVFLIDEEVFLIDGVPRCSASAFFCTQAVVRVIRRSFSLQRSSFPAFRWRFSLRVVRRLDDRFRPEANTPGPQITAA